ncbi:glycosyltransferase family 2 protein [Halapricum hydrolyticum]|uniref:Glycosyltransferase family 2 protein n=1 Tax=Halapricum hydrolyticum TaxID=2979991 RepID=A0AAE3I9L5_9EURY|nr:glycosyltransferase family 2 protein [Halapricum hydrolyticum]MCU4718208.1 glycosyltransferase family 2 protein [Halapricum hydrolyticum]MCU4726351.1 glycosyltransferase family 2 protein [Halapricum hydrolyticum]
MTPNDHPSASRESVERDDGAARETVSFLGPDSETTPILSVVIPTLNEEGGIGPTLESLREGVADLGVPTEVIICDNSSDRTPEIAREDGAIVVTPDQRGYGAAYKYGFERARGEYIVMGDADTTYDFGELPALYRLLVEEEADMVLGSRFAGTIEPGAMPWLHKYVGNPALTAFLNLFYDLDVTDAHTGFRVFRSDVLEALSLRSDGMEFASEMIMQAGAIGLDVVETPITYHPRVGEAKLSTFRDGWRHVRFMLVNAPGYLFSLPGLLLGLSGIGVLLGAQFGVGPDPGLLGLIVGSLLIVVGFMAVSFGVFSAQITSPIRKPRDPVTRWVEHHFNLEGGVLSGILLALFSLLALFASLVGTVTSGSGPLSTPTIVLLVTVIALGVVIVFEAFFFATLIETRLFDHANRPDLHVDDD